MRRLAFVTCVTVVSVVALRVDAQSRPRWEDVFAAFARADYGVLSPAVVTPDDQRSLREAIIRNEKLWLKEWRRWHVLLMLEAAALPTRAGDQIDGLLLGKAVSFMAARPAAIGAHMAGDRFERLWHTTAAAIVLGTLSPNTLRSLLDEIQPRIGASAVPAANRLVEPRLSLISAMCAEQLIHPGAFTLEPSNRGARLIAGGTVAQAETALAMFDEALLHEANAPEAAVRRANVLLRLRRPAEALAGLDRVPDRRPDRILEYWKGLVRGRVLDALGRLDDAVGVYETAHAIFPLAPSPHVALAVLHFRQGRRNEALAWTERSYALPNHAQDPLWSYWRGDYRFAGTWLTELREATR
jgi:tetratricopeptide (TPR) repeat protein